MSWVATTADFRDATVSLTEEVVWREDLAGAAPRSYELLADLEDGARDVSAEAAAPVFVELADPSGDGATFGAFPWPAAVLAAAAIEIARRQVRRSADRTPEAPSSRLPEVDDLPGLLSTESP
jgi:hypothetical protein